MKDFLRRIYHKIVPESITKYIWNTRSRGRYLKSMIEDAPRRLARRDLLRFDIHVAEHCNLNCKGCEHFSTLAPKKYLDAEIFERDCRRLSELTGGWIDQIAVLGGEPLLHPQITSILSIARNCFPTGKILILTNGTLLSVQNGSFWESCNKNHLHIEISSYPLNIDRDMIKQTARSYSVPLAFVGGGGG
jgi:molybdenum cofactor biosynthesis enzyme MoaA